MNIARNRLVNPSARIFSMPRYVSETPSGNFTVAICFLKSSMIVPVARPSVSPLT